MRPKADIERDIAELETRLGKFKTELAEHDFRKEYADALRQLATALEYGDAGIDSIERAFDERCSKPRQTVELRSFGRIRIYTCKIDMR